MIEWSSDYKVGIDFIDKQHEKIFEIAARAEELLKNDYYTDKYNKIMEILSELKDYTVFHFNAEEEYMISISYKKYFSQKIEHDEFIKKIDDIDHKEIDKNQDQFVANILEFIIVWLTEHILEKDILIGEAKK